MICLKKASTQTALKGEINQATASINAIKSSLQADINKVTDSVASININRELNQGSNEFFEKIFQVTFQQKKPKRNFFLHFRANFKAEKWVNFIFCFPNLNLGAFFGCRSIGYEFVKDTSILNNSLMNNTQSRPSFIELKRQLQYA